MKTAEYLNVLKKLNCLKRIKTISSNSYWFQVLETDYRINVRRSHKSRNKVYYKEEYFLREVFHKNDPCYLGHKISFEKFFDNIPNDAKVEIAFHLNLFR